jgi:hypothetical protein
MGYNRDSKKKWGTQFNYAGIQHQTLDQYTGMSDLIAKLKKTTPYKAKAFLLELF